MVDPKEAAANYIDAPEDPSFMAALEKNL